MNQKGFIQIPILIAIIMGVLVLGGAYVAFKHFSQPIGQLSVPSSVEKSPQQNTTPNTTPATNAIPIVNANSLFGTMIAFNINEAAMSTPGMMDALQKGWTEFRKDSSAYQNLKSNLKKLIQDRIKLVKATGFSLDREFFPYFWNVIEPQKGQFDWEMTDFYAQAASNAGVKISAIIQPFANWDQKNISSSASCNALDFAYYDYKASPPNDLAEYKNFLTKRVERYKDNIAIWEIGNEVEGDCGGYKNNPQGYAALLKISYETIKKVDQQAIILNGGALEFGEARSFWQQFFALGGGQYTDYFNLHYNAARSPDVRLDPATFQEDLTFFNNLMEKNGGKKPLYLTEFGIYSGTPSEPAPMTGGPAQGPGQTQTNLPTQPIQSGQSPNQPSSGGECGDGICDVFEKANPNACPQDCSGSVPSGNLEQPAMQPIQEQAPRSKYPAKSEQATV